ncbi:MAG: hypothetical protein FWF29_11330 [Treponema sp.]|nr:hypothetical protein [Treponema sp.]
MKKFILMCTAVFACFSCSTIDMAKRYPNMVADLDPFTVGTVDVSFDQLFSSKVKAVPVTVIFYPRENTVALEFRYELVRYRQFWDQAGRQRFTDAVELYKHDFENKKLETRYNKTRAVYGKVQSHIEWETFKFTSTYKSSPILELGYRFRGQSPYFAVLQRSAKEETGVMSGSDIDSQQITMYYTKAQGDTLAGLFNQDFLRDQAGVSAPQAAETEAENAADQGDAY